MQCLSYCKHSCQAGPGLCWHSWWSWSIDMVFLAKKLDHHPNHPSLFNRADCVPKCSLGYKWKDVTIEFITSHRQFHNVCMAEGGDVYWENHTAHISQTKLMEIMSSGVRELISVVISITTPLLWSLTAFNCSFPSGIITIVNHRGAVCPCQQAWVSSHETAWYFSWQ